jgi:hypothetical protein
MHAAAVRAATQYPGTGKLSVVEPIGTWQGAAGNPGGV